MADAGNSQSMPEIIPPDDQIIQETLSKLNEWDLANRDVCMPIAGYMEDIYNITERHANRLLSLILQQGLVRKHPDIDRDYDYLLTETGRIILEKPNGWEWLKKENARKQKAESEQKAQLNQPQQHIHIGGNVTGSNIGHGNKSFDRRPNRNDIPVSNSNKAINKTLWGSIKSVVEIVSWIAGIIGTMLAIWLAYKGPH